MAISYFDSGNTDPDSNLYTVYIYIYIIIQLTPDSNDNNRARLAQKADIVILKRRKSHEY